MATTAKRRLLKDLQKIQKQNDSGTDAVPDPDNIFEWDAVIHGPEQTIWEGGTFILKINFPEDYPNKPPKVVFKSRMFHPNIYDNGNICLDILDNKWSPIYDIIAILTSIRSLLCDPNTSSPANMTASKTFQNDKKLYEMKVKQVVELSWQHIEQ